MLFYFFYLKNFQSIVIVLIFWGKYQLAHVMNKLKSNADLEAYVFWACLKKNRFSLIALTHNRRRRSFIPIPSFPKKDSSWFKRLMYLTMHNCLDDQNAWKRTDPSLGFDPLTYLPGTLALISIHTQNSYVAVRTERSLVPPIILY